MQLNLKILRDVNHVMMLVQKMFFTLSNLLASGLFSSYYWTAGAMRLHSGQLANKTV
jgi:hypothetical protein